VIATEDKVVVDPNNGTTRQIVAGQQVPPDLVDADDAGQSVVEEGYEGTPRSADDGSGGLSKHTRAELDEIAAEAGVENPADLGTKDDVIEAIKAAQGE
jgi:hypothetical protein